MSEPEASANDQDPRASQPQERSHDKVLVDAIGYTKGLVALLDSLTEGFQRRGRELDDQRARLAILQSERRTILQERSEFDARITALTAERDGLRTTLEARERELDDQRARLASLDDERRASLQTHAEFDAHITALTAERDGLRTTLEARERELGDLHQGAAHVQAVLEGQTREIQTVRAGMADPTRQAEELREVVRALERQLQRTGQLPPRAPVTPAPWESAPSGSRPTMPQVEAAACDALASDQQPSERGRIMALTAERDGLRGALEAHEQEIDRLRQDVARGKAALEEQTREMHALRLGMAETVRQAEEIRKVLQALEREIESAGRREAVLEEALEAERRQVREAAVRASQEQAALREDLADAENLLAEARKDIGASQGSIASLQRTVDEEHAGSATLRERLETQTAELAHLRAAMQAVPTLLNELVKAFGGGAEPLKKDSSADGQESNWLEALVPDPAVRHPEADALAILQTVREALGDVLPPATGSEAPPADLATDPAGLRRRAEHIADHWRRAVRKRSEPARPEEPARRGRRPLPEQGGPAVENGDVQPEGEAPPIAKPEPSPAPAGPSSVSPTILKRPGSPSGMTVECTFPASGTEAACILRGEITRINDMGLLAAFEERLPEGAPMVVRFVRSGEVVSCLGRVVRVQESPGTSTAHASLHHLIRFESPVSVPGESVRSSVG